MDMNSAIMQMLAGGRSGMWPGMGPGTMGGVPTMPPAPGGLGASPAAGMPGLPYPRPGAMMGPLGASGGDPAALLAALGQPGGGMGGGMMGGAGPMGGVGGINRFTPPQPPRQSAIGDLVRQHFNSMPTPPSQSLFSRNRADGTGTLFDRNRYR